MAKFYGEIGFAKTVEEERGKWVEKSIKRKYYGDITKLSRRSQSSDKVNDDLVLSNELSIVADPYAMENFYCIRYVNLMGTLWKVTGVEVKYPRLILTIGGIYNGK